MRAGDAAIALSGVSLTLPGARGPVNILRDVDLRVEPGESVGVMGPSGAGKTSLLMVVSGLERATSGTLLVAGRDVGAMDENALARFRGGHVGIVFQSFHLVAAMTALENVALPLELARVPDAFDRAQASLEAVGLSHRLGHYPSQLSGGEQQRVGLARAFASRPDIILADEPTGNLDRETGELVIERLFTLAGETGCTLLLVTHDRALADRCSRRLSMRDGRVAEA
ncbi:ABC transporter ATP-binding protein [Desulfohalovibrio reitneri]|uniref:ABC transporter ATP-binding protein n=1 Tax=Desulfohalovibrio reitneri TaxID=1307759 RepID=UPI0004A7097D|nr:ABC transporter ATP-binding protein [Desulfohalovibrio reitneri]